MFQNSSKSARLIVAGLALALCTASFALGIGDKAPALTFDKWVKGKPVNGFEKGKWYVVEFWATWCGPCRQSIPHITELAKKHKNVTFIGANVWEERNPTDTKWHAKVDTFVKEMGDKMGYNVAIDTLKGDMAKNWMQAAEQGGIPTAFLIDGSGTIAWIGHPMEMDDVLDKAVAGKWSIAEAKKAQEQEKAMEADFQKINAFMQKGDKQGAINELDAFIKKYPKTEANLGPLRFSLMLEVDERGAYAYARKLHDGAMKDNAMALNAMAWEIADGKELKSPDYALALSMSMRAAEITKNEEPNILDTLALCYFKSGMKDKAVATQSKAIELLKKGGADADTIADFEERLKTYQAAAAMID